MKIEQGCTKTQIAWLMMLRFFIGWHFVYEGLIKIMNPKWTSLPYSLDSKGPVASFLIKLAQDDSLMITINFLNGWVLLSIDLGLTLGCLYRLPSVGGMIFLALHTLSHPSLMGAGYVMPFEGSYLQIDKDLVEFTALGSMCIFPASQVIGFDRVLGRVCPILYELKFI